MGNELTVIAFVRVKEHPEARACDSQPGLRGRTRAEA
jgi:hypothetical protein